MKTMNKLALMALLGAGIIGVQNSAKAMDFGFGDEAAAAHVEAPSVAQVDAYGKDVTRRMRALFDALMAGPTVARLKETKATDLALLFDANGAEGSLLHFYRQEFVRCQTLFTEDLSQDWPDASYLDKLFSATINNITSFLRWSMLEVLPLLGGNDYRITIGTDDMISSCLAAIGNVEPRAMRMTRDGARTRMQYFANQINGLWEMPDMPEFNFGDEEEAEAGDDGADEPRARGGARRGHGTRGGMPFFVISGKGVVVNQGQMGVILEDGSQSQFQFQPGSKSVFYLPQGADVRFERAQPREHLRLPAPQSTGPVIEDLGTVLNAQTTTVARLGNGARAVIRNTRGLIAGAAGWLMVEYAARGGLNLDANPEAAVLATMIGCATQLWLSRR